MRGDGVAGCVPEQLYRWGAGLRAGAAQRASCAGSRTEDWRRIAWSEAAAVAEGYGGQANGTRSARGTT